MGGALKSDFDHALVIEFMSTPGAGKTTIRPAVKEFFASRGLHAWTAVDAGRPFARRTMVGKLVGSMMPVSVRSALLWQTFYHLSKLYRLKFRFENRALLRSVLRFQRQRPIAEADRRHVLHWFINLTGQYAFLKQYAHPDDVLIFDEGFTHRVVQLFASESETPDLERVRDYLDMLTKPDLIIRPRASLETCIYRVDKRGIWERFRDRDRKTFCRFMSNAHAVVNFAADHLQSKGWPVVEIINDHRPPADSQRQLLVELSSIYRSY